MLKILVVTGTRAEYGLLYWTMKKIQQDEELELNLIVTGNHLSPDYGHTVDIIRKDGFQIDEEIDMILRSDKKSAIAKSMGIELMHLAQSFDRIRPDLLLILGDRYETFIAATCAMAMNIPIAHMNGGESTEGLIDEQIRHAITKMAHIHFAGAEYYKERIIGMGEEAWRVWNVGQAGVENIKRLNLLTKEELEASLGMRFDKKTFLITYHPVTLESENTEWQIDQVLKAIEGFDAQLVFTYPNADFGSSKIIQRIDSFQHKNKFVFHSLGQLRYLSLLKYSDLMIGNSSSGIIETPLFKLPVINIGNRQKGRIRNHNIIDVPCEQQAIQEAIHKVFYDEQFTESLNDMKNVFGDGTTSEEVVEIIKKLANKKELMFKKLTY